MVMGALLEELGPVGKYGKAMLHNKSNLRDDTTKATFSQTKFEEMR